MRPSIFMLAKWRAIGPRSDATTSPADTLRSTPPNVAKKFVRRFHLCAKAARNVGGAVHGAAGGGACSFDAMAIEMADASREKTDAQYGSALTSDMMAMQCDGRRAGNDRSTKTCVCVCVVVEEDPPVGERDPCMHAQIDENFFTSVRKQVGRPAGRRQGAEALRPPKDSPRPPASHHRDHLSGICQAFFGSGHATLSIGGTAGRLALKRLYLIRSALFTSNASSCLTMRPPSLADVFSVVVTR